MVVLNNSNSSSFIFILMDLPGLEAAHCWAAILVCSAYILSLLGNITIMYIVRSVPSLHIPMYLFLSVLSMADLGLSAFTLPSMAIVFLLGQRKVGAATCFLQLSSSTHSQLLNQLCSWPWPLTAVWLFENPYTMPPSSQPHALGPLGWSL